MAHFNVSQKMKKEKTIGLIVAILTLLVTLLAWLFPKSETSLNVQNGDQERSKTQKQVSDISPLNTRNLTTAMIIKQLKRISLNSNKIEFIEKNIRSMPETVALSELNLMLDLLDLESDKIKLTKLFSPKINKQYSDGDYDKFIKNFTLDSNINEATSALLGR